MKQQEKNKYPLNLSKNEAFEVIKICFAETKRKYLSYGDFHFLLNKDGKIGKTINEEKKKLYQQWKKQLKVPEVYTGWGYPYRKFIFGSSRFNEIINALINDKKLKKILKNKKPKYQLLEKVDTESIHDIKYKKLIDECSLFDRYTTYIRKNHSPVSYYGIPLVDPHFIPYSYNEPFRAKLDKIANRFRKNIIDFMSIMSDLTSFVMNKIIDGIDNGNYKEIDKKLAFLYLDEYYKHYSLDEGEIKDFIWTGDGKILEFLPKNHTIDSEVSDLLFYFVRFEAFWRNKLIVIKPEPGIDQIKKSGEDLSKIRKKIKQYTKKY